MITVQASISPNVGFIGDEFLYTVQVKHGVNDQVSLVPSSGIFSPFESLGGTQRFYENQEGYQTTFVVRLSMYELGTFYVPTQTVLIHQNGQEMRFEVPAIPLRIHTLLNSEIVTPSALKSPMSADISWGMYLGWLIVLMVAFFSGFFAYRFFKKKFQKTVQEWVQEDTRSAYEIAYEALQALEKDDLAVSGDYKHHYLRLSELLKQLFSKQYDHPVSEMTTDETLAFLSRRLTFAQVSMVREVLEVGDLVKFAKSIPANEIHYDLLVKAKLIIEWYKPVVGESAP